MQLFAITVIIVIVGAVLMLLYCIDKYGRFDMSRASESEIAARYRLVCGVYPDPALDRARIPSELHTLVPLAQRYGHGNQILRDDCLAKMSETEAKSLASLIDANYVVLNAWLEKYPASFPADEILAFRELIVIRKQLRPATASEKAG